MCVGLVHKALRDDGRRRLDEGRVHRVYRGPRRKRNVVNAIEALGVIVVLCCAHRLNTVVVWMLGIGGTVNTCRNKPMEVLMRKLAACVGKFNHSAVNNSELKALQELVPQFSKIYELIRRNDTW